MKGYYKMPQQDGRGSQRRRLAADRRPGGRGRERIYQDHGRLKDVIIRGGENIYPKEVEDFLRTYPISATSR